MNFAPGRSEVSRKITNKSVIFTSQVFCSALRKTRNEWLILCFFLSSQLRSCLMNQKSTLIGTAIREIGKTLIPSWPQPSSVYTLAGSLSLCRENNWVVCTALMPSDTPSRRHLTQTTGLWPRVYWGLGWTGAGWDIAFPGSYCSAQQSSTTRTYYWGLPLIT